MASFVNRGIYNGLPRDIKTSSTGDLSVTVDGWNAGPFGDLTVAEKVPLIQGDFIYGLNDAFGTVTVSGTGATGDAANSRLRIQSGTAAAGTAKFDSRQPARYRPGQGIVALFTGAWVSSAANSSQFIGMATDQDAYGFGFDGTAFGVLYRANSVDTWIPQSTWNGDKCDGNGLSGFNWNKTFGNVMAVKYPFLGYGPITFWVLHPTGYWILAHTIQYPNTSALVQITNPLLNFRAQATNAGNTSNLISYVGSIGVFSVGAAAYQCLPNYGTDNVKTAVSTETNILTLRNATSYNGIPNRGVIRIRSLSYASDGGNGYGRLRVKRNPTIGGSAVYTAINGTTADNGVTITSGQSMASVNTAGTTVAGGTTVFNSSTPRNGGYQIDMDPYNIFLVPGDILCFSMQASVNIDCPVAVNWDEDI